MNDYTFEVGLVLNMISDTRVPTGFTHKKKKDLTETFLFSKLGIWATDFATPNHYPKCL